MKFGGTSVGGGAERIRAVVEIVRQRVDRRPVVVVSALGGVTDLLERSIAVAAAGDLDALDPLMADVERRYRWAAASVESPSRRHDLELEIAAGFEELRERLRSIRILGEGTPRSVDGILAFGDEMAARVVAAAFEDHGVSTRAVDARRVVLTDATHGLACPDSRAISERCAEELTPWIEQGVVPVLAGFVGATPSGETTTLGRGGSDTTAALLGLALEAEEIQIWTDVDGLMTADPRAVPSASTLERASFAEAAELAFRGARVLHAASVAPAVAQRIPVRILNSHNPECEGTRIQEAPPGRRRAVVASLAHRSPVSSVRVVDPAMRGEPGMLDRVLDAITRAGLTRELLAASDSTVSLVIRGEVSKPVLERALGSEWQVTVETGRALICAVGDELRGETARNEVRAAFSDVDPEWVEVGAAPVAAVAIVRQESLESALRRLHRRLCEEDRR